MNVHMKNARGKHIMANVIPIWSGGIYKSREGMRVLGRSSWSFATSLCPSLLIEWLLTVPPRAALLNPVPGLLIVRLPQPVPWQPLVSQRLCYIQLPDPQLSVRVSSANWVPPAVLLAGSCNIPCVLGELCLVWTVHSTVTRRRTDAVPEWQAVAIWRRCAGWRSWMLSWNAGSGNRVKRDVPLVCPDYQCYFDTIEDLSKRSSISSP